jgi:hypothetical protein
LDDRANAQEEGHAAWLEDAALGVPKRPALALEQDPLLDGVVAEDWIAGLEAAGVIKGGLPNDGVPGDQLVIRHGVHGPG